MFIDPALEVKGFEGRRHVMLPLLVGILQDALEFIETSVTGWNCVQDLDFKFKMTVTRGVAVSPRTVFIRNR
jgi:hypothetical protein